MLRICFFVVILFSSVFAFGQDDFIGAGNIENVTVTSSHNEGLSEEINTVNGSGLDAKYFEASRFLAHSTLGYTYSDIQSLVDNDLNFESWIDEEIALPPTLHLTLLDEIMQEAIDLWVENGGNPLSYLGPISTHFNYTFWQAAMTAEDQLRLRVALALSEIFVLSMESDLDSYGDGLASFYDIFVSNAFGNFKDILDEVTFHPCMGYYLSHLNNAKTEGTVHPNENYAREILQLFTIGLFQLSLDGSINTDQNNDPIPTYDNEDIMELAKVFTGLYGGADFNDGPDVEFGDEISAISRTIPMQMFEDEHEPGQKIILDDYVIPAGQSGTEDIEDALTHIFNHQNVGPFISLRLIQRLVKSNPTPQYVQRVAQTFNNNGSGERGDLEAVIKAILLDAEARDCEWMLDGSAGKLREPILKYTQFAKAIGGDSPEGRFWNQSFDFRHDADQIPLSAPSVFNFFLPDYAPGGPIEEAGQIAPEFQIFNARTSIGFFNRLNDWSMEQILMFSDEEGDPLVATDLTELELLADFSEVLLTRLDLLFTAGQLTLETRENLKNALDQIQGSNKNNDRARLAAYLMIFSPDFAVIK